MSGLKKIDAHIAIDLGSDTLKVAYAFGCNNRTYTGKIAHNSWTMTAIPAVAYYDKDNSTWYFGDQVTNQQRNTYITVVKIKKLLSLLQQVKGPSKSVVSDENVKFYCSDSHFPKFIFPYETHEVLDFSKLIAEQNTFIVSGFTPQKVCEMYFAYVAKMVKARLATLMNNFNVDYDLYVSLVYPPHVGADYVKELTRLLLLGFGSGVRIRFALSMTKALSIYASHRNLIKENESALIFNIGEEKTFVAKTNVYDGAVSIDGVEGHASPIDLGGNDIDKAVANHLETLMGNRETMGSPSAGDDGHIYERGLLTKQYLFLQEIKSAKIVFGMVNPDDKWFTEGIPVNVSRDLYIQLKLNHSDFAKCIGINPYAVSAEKGSFADELCKYIEDELCRSINRDVTRVFISGGVVETRGLVDVIRARLKDKKSGVTVGTFESEDSRPYDTNGDGFAIYEHEDAIYAPAVGCAIASLLDLKVKTVTSLAYGTDVKGNEPGQTVFGFIMDKLQELPESGSRPFLVRNYSVDLRNVISYRTFLYMFSVALSEKEMVKRPFASQIDYNSDKKLVITRVLNNDKQYVKKMEQLISFVQRNTKSDAEISYYYKGRRVMLSSIHGGSGSYGAADNVFYFHAGVIVDSTGVASPHVENSKEYNAGRKATIYYLRTDKHGNAMLDSKDFPLYDSASQVVDAAEIELRIKPFSVSITGGD